MHNVDIRNISLGQIQYFITAVELGSFTKAATYFHITQSALSKKIASLEQQLDLILFFREKKQLVLTPSGKYLYEQWVSFAERLDEHVQVAHNIQQGYGDHLVVATLTSFKHEMIISPAIQNFHQKYPQFHMQIENTSEQTIFQMLLDDEADVIFNIRYAFEEKEYDDIGWAILSECPRDACMLESNPLSSKTELEPSDLIHSRFVGVSPHVIPTYAKEIKDLCARASFTPDFSCYAKNTAGLTLNLINENDIFICDRYYKDHGSSNLCFVPIKGTKSGVVMAWKKNSKKPTVHKFVEETVKLFKENHE